MRRTALAAALFAAFVDGRALSAQFRYDTQGGASPPVYGSIWRTGMPTAPQNLWVAADYDLSGRPDPGTELRGVVAWPSSIFAAGTPVDVILWPFDAVQALPPLVVYGVAITAEDVAFLNSGTTNPSEFRPDLFDSLDDGNFFGNSPQSNRAGAGVAYSLNIASLGWINSRVASGEPYVGAAVAFGSPGQPWKALEMSIIIDPIHMTGDANADGAINNLDIEPFANGLTGAFPQSVRSRPVYLQDLDVNGDNAVNNLDITPFAALLTGGGAAVTEPSALVLAALGSAGIGWSRAGARGNRRGVRSRIKQASRRRGD